VLEAGTPFKGYHGKYFLRSPSQPVTSGRKIQSKAISFRKLFPSAKKHEALNPEFASVFDRYPRDYAVALEFKHGHHMESLFTQFGFRLIVVEGNCTVILLNP